MEDPQIPINRGIIVIEAPTATRGIARAQDRRDEGIVVHGPDLPVAVQDLAPVHLVELVEATLHHQRNNIVVLIPKVHAGRGLLLDHVPNLVPDQDSLALSLVLAQGLPRKPNQDRPLDLPNKEGLQVPAEKERLMDETMVTSKTTAKTMLTTMEMIKISIMFLL